MRRGEGSEVKRGERGEREWQIFFWIDNKKRGPTNNKRDG